MAGSRLRQFDRQLKRLVSPSLVEHGFTSFPQRVFRRSIEHEGTSTTQIAEFQIGIKGRFIGRFTVNLGVYNEDLMPEERRLGLENPLVPNCMSDLTQRLGFSYIAEQSVIARLLRRPKPSPYDHWWAHSEDETEMAQTMQLVTSCLLENGLRWLDSRTSRKAFAWAKDELERRKAWKQQLAEPNAIPTFEASPFPETE